METVKDILNFCNAAIFFSYKNISNIEELNQFLIPFFSKNMNYINDCY